MLRVLIPLALVLALPAAAAAIAPNPETGTGRFAFDLEMRIDVKSDRASGPMTLFVNSADGSMALDNPHTTLWAMGMRDIPGLQVHHLILRPRAAMVCGVHPEFGQGCLPLGGDLVPALGRMAEDDQIARYFASVAATDQSTAPCCVSGIDGLEHIIGRTSDGAKMTLWFDPGRATIRTERPFLGPGVGVLRDMRSGALRIARHAEIVFAEGPARWLALHLISLDRRQRAFDLGAYPVVSAFTTPGIEDAGQLSQRLIAEQGAQIQALSREMAEACPRGSAGNACRAEYRARIKALEAEIKAKIQDYARRRGLPVPADD